MTGVSAVSAAGGSAVSAAGGSAVSAARASAPGASAPGASERPTLDPRALPGHWHAAGHPVPIGDTVIFDLDGVLADALHRQHFLHREHPDWSGFYAGVDADTVIEAGRALAAAIRDDVAVVILTGRIDDVAGVTRDWLAAHGLRWDLLICRPPHEDDSSRHAVDYKREEIARLRGVGLEPVLAVDDNRRIVEMYGEAGVPGVYFPSGYYDSSSRYDGGV